MKILILFLAILPYIWAANDSHIFCPDGSACMIGETCLEDSGKYNCSDIEEHEKQNKKLIPSSYFQKKMVNETEVNGNCSGVLCSENLCCEFDSGTCCSNSTSCCPKDYHCCGTDISGLWCCKTKQRCADTFLYCIAGVGSLSSTFLPLIMMLIIPVFLKHF